MGIEKLVLFPSMGFTAHALVTTLPSSLTALERALLMPGENKLAGNVFVLSVTPVLLAVCHLRRGPY